MTGKQLLMVTQKNQEIIVEKDKQLLWDLLAVSLAQVTAGPRVVITEVDLIERTHQDGIKVWQAIVGLIGLTVMEIEWGWWKVDQNIEVEDVKIIAEEIQVVATDAGMLIVVEGGPMNVETEDHLVGEKVRDK